jgi:hypothetical protein
VVIPLSNQKTISGHCPGNFSVTLWCRKEDTTLTIRYFFMNTNQSNKPVMVARQSDILNWKPTIWYSFMDTNQFDKLILSINSTFSIESQPYGIPLWTPINLAILLWLLINLAFLIGSQPSGILTWISINPYNIQLFSL